MIRGGPWLLFLTANNCSTHAPNCTPLLVIVLPINITWMYACPSVKLTCIHFTCFRCRQYQNQTYTNYNISTLWLVVYVYVTVTFGHNLQYLVPMNWHVTISWSPFLQVCGLGCIICNHMEVRIDFIYDIVGATKDEECHEDGDGCHDYHPAALMSL